MTRSRAKMVERIILEIEDAITSDFDGEGIMSDFGYGRLFYELPPALQRKELEEGVNWDGLTAAERESVVTRVLRDVHEKFPEEIYPGTWLDGVAISVDRDEKVIDMAAVKKQVAVPGREQSLDERVCEPDRCKPFPLKRAIDIDMDR